MYILFVTFAIPKNREVHLCGTIIDMGGQYMGQWGFWVFILLTGIVLLGIVLFIARFERNRRFWKYIPAILLFAGGAASFVKAGWFSEGLEGLGYIILSMLILGGFVVTLFTAMIIDLIRRYNKKRAGKSDNE